LSTQTPPEQNSVAAQPASFAHPPPQIVPEQEFAPHDWYRIAGHLPSPLQNVASVATPSAQLAARQDCALSGYVHRVVVVPLHVPPQGEPSVAHGGRMPVGGPVTGTHVPSELG
jgi:hypothetical protein